MIRDLKSLARDIERLFRARADGRQMPVGERVLSSGHDWWQACDAEERAYRLVNAVDLWDIPAYAHAAGIQHYKRGLRPRRHVAMLALSEPEHFRACLAEVDAAPYTVETVIGGAHPFCCDVRTGRVVTRSSAADIARTARYLQGLDARLTEYREARGNRKAIAAGRLADADMRAAHVMSYEDEAAVMAIDDV